MDVYKKCILMEGVLYLKALKARFSFYIRTASQMFCVIFSVNQKQMIHLRPFFSSVFRPRHPAWLSTLLFSVEHQDTSVMKSLNN